MNPPLDLRRYWRDRSRASSLAEDHPSWWLWDRNDSELEEAGFYRLSALAKHECLFLLGRPGAGKSTEVDRLDSGDVDGFKDEQIVVISCKEISANIAGEVEQDPKWLHALGQDKPVRLVLDALDEGFLRTSDYFSRLKRSLGVVRHRHPQLRLILVTRPAWDDTIAASVYEIWGGEGQPKVFTLEPLSKESQQRLVESKGIKQPEKFFQWIAQNSFEEFVQWPRYLEWMADQFQTGGATKLTYTQLCRHRVMRGFGEDKRIEEADRAKDAATWTDAMMFVAATLVCCGKEGIALDGIEPVCLTSDEIFSEHSSISIPKKEPFGREQLREAVRKASHLVEIYQGYYRFQNYSDLEYLAAAALVTLEAEQLADLFGSNDELGRWRVFPQLATTAANLASQSTSFLAWVLDHDPRVLMRMDFASQSNEIKAQAVDAVLRCTADADSTGGHEQYSRFSTLRHPEIGKQLGQWLFNESVSLIARDLAYDIALATCGIEFWEEPYQNGSVLSDVFLRSRLPTALLRYGQNWSEERLREIAASPNNRLAGAAMTALLDQGNQPRDLAPFLREPSDNTLDAYYILLGRLAQRCEADDVPALLGAIKSWSTFSGFHNQEQKLAEALIAKAITVLERDDIRNAVTGFLNESYVKHQWVLYDSGRERWASLGLHDAGGRRKLFLALIDAFPQELDPGYLSMCVPLSPEDYLWALQTLASVEGEKAGLLAKLIGRCFWRIALEHPEELQVVYTASEELRQEIPNVDSDGVVATLKRQHDKNAALDHKNTEECRHRSEARRSEHSRRLEATLSACRGGQLDDWPTLCWLLSMNEVGQQTADYYRCVDVRELPGWEVADDTLQAELTVLARDFLINVTIPETTTEQIPGEFFGLTYALSLHKNSLESDADIRAAIRPAWIQGLLRHGSVGDVSPLADLIDSLTALDPEAAKGGFMVELLSCWNRNGYLSSSLASAIWNQPFEDALVQILETASIQPVSFQSGIGMLAKHNLACAEAIAGNRLSNHADQPSTPAGEAVIGACLFICSGDVWEKAWPIFLADTASARRVMLNFSLWHTQRGDDVLSSMPTRRVANMYSGLLDLFRPADAPRIGELGEDTPLPRHHDIYDFQSKLQRMLEARGAYSELKSIFEQKDFMREVWWIGRSLEQARTNAHALRWSQPVPPHFIRFLTTNGGTFVRDNDSLKQAVIASLGRYEKQLHPHGIVNLWDDHNRPRVESVLQNDLTMHLRREFQEQKIVVNREVKVQGHEGVDILVEEGQLSVTIEVKQAHGSDKDRPVLDSMRIQLRNAYLAKLGRTHGIYVVGWYFCPTFKESSLSGISNISEARAFFDRQAVSLSTDGYSLSATVLDCTWLETITGGAKRSRSKKSK